jgi:hypothetical protein
MAMPATRTRPPIDLTAEQAKRSRAALAERHRYRFRSASPGCYPVEVTGPEGRQYTVTGDGCGCKDHEHRGKHGILCRHREMVALYLDEERAALALPCPVCEEALAYDVTEHEGRGLLTEWACESCLYRRVT